MIDGSSAATHHTKHGRREADDFIKQNHRGKEPSMARGTVRSPFRGLFHCPLSLDSPINPPSSVRGTPIWAKGRQGNWVPGVHHQRSIWGAGSDSGASVELQRVPLSTVAKWGEIQLPGTWSLTLCSLEGLIVSNKLATPSPLCPAEEWIPSRVPWVVQSQGEAATYSSLNQLGRSECHQGRGKGFPPLAAY